MDEIAAVDAKNNLETLLDRVERGEEIVITRHGKAVARFVPNSRPQDLDRASAAVKRIRERARTLNRTKPSDFQWPATKNLRDQDRP